MEACSLDGSWLHLNDSEITPFADIVQIAALESARETAVAIPHALTDPTYTDSYVATSGLDTNLWWYIVDYGTLSNSQGGTKTGLLRGDQSQRTAAIGSSILSTTQDQLLPSRSLHSSAGFTTEMNANVPGSSRRNTLDDDLATLLADWHEDNVSFPLFETLFQNDIIGSHD
jgi:hypothetical protein